MNVETLHRLNNKAIADGLLLPDGETSRPYPVSAELGKELSEGEKLLYDFITAETYKGEGPVSTERIYKEMMGIEPQDEVDSCVIWTAISRIRDKLGDESIISRRDFGYLSKSALIDLQVETNLNASESLPQVDRREA